MWKTFFASFGIMLLAELGDKTQLAIISLAGRYKSPWTVFAGAALALILATGIGVFVGGFLSTLIGARGIRYVSGGLFILFGVLVLTGK